MGMQVYLVMKMERAHMYGHKLAYEQDEKDDKLKK